MGARPGERFGFPSTRITSATTTQVTGSATKGGVLVRLIVEVATTGTVTCNDGVGTRLILPIGALAGSYELNLLFPTKIEIVTSAADRIVAVWEA